MLDTQKPWEYRVQDPNSLDSFESIGPDVPNNFHGAHHLLWEKDASDIRVTNSSEN